MSNDNERGGDTLSNAMMSLGALVGIGFAIIGALWLWPELAGWDRRWKAVVTIFGGVFTVFASVILFAVMSGIIEAMAGMFRRSPRK